MADANRFFGVDHGASRSAADVAGPSRSVPNSARPDWRYRLVDFGGDRGIRLAEVHYTAGKPTKYRIDATFAWVPKYGGEPAETLHRALSLARDATLEPILLASEISR